MLRCHDRIQSQRAETATSSRGGDELWLARENLLAATGWELKPEGVCRGEECVPLPRGQENEFVRSGGAEFDLARFARLLGQQVVRDEAAGVWAFGPRVRTSAFLDAPDFRLPDLAGRAHSLSDYRGKKVVLVSWASW